MHELFFGYFKSIFTLTVLVAHFGHYFNLPFDSLYIDLSSIKKIMQWVQTRRETEEKKTK